MKYRLLSGAYILWLLRIVEVGYNKVYIYILEVGEVQRTSRVSVFSLESMTEPPRISILQRHPLRSRCGCAIFAMVTLR